MNSDTLGTLPPRVSLADGDFEAWRRQCEADHRERRQLVDAYLATVPQSITCQRHPDQLGMLDAQRSDIGKAAYGHCPTCLEEHRRAQERYAEEARIKAMNRAGIPPILHHATLDNWLPKPTIPITHREQVAEFVKARRGFLIMTGEVGTGKTHLAVGAMLAYGVSSSRLITHAGFMRSLRLRYDDHHLEDIEEACREVELLGLDDVGLAVGGKDELPTIHRVLDYRHGHRKPTIITTNLSMPQLADFLGPRMADRLSESSREVLEFFGESHRSQMRDAYFARP